MFSQNFEGKFTPVDSEVDPRNEQFLLMRFNLQNQIQIRLKLDSTLGYLSETIQNSDGNQVNNVSFYSIAGAKLPLCEKIADLTDYPILCQVNNNRVFALNFSQEFDITRSRQSNPIQDEEHFFDFASGIGLKGYQRFFFSNFSHRLMHALPNSNKDIKTADVAQSLAQVLRYYQNKGYVTKYSHSNKKINELRERLAFLEDQVSKKNLQIQQIEKSSRRKATALCLLGSSIVVSQFAAIAAGTFHFYSWDIMEPICYLMTFGNFTFSYFFYLGMKRDLELTNIHDILSYRFTRKVAKRQGIDLVELEQQKEEITTIYDSIRQAQNIC